MREAQDKANTVESTPAQHIGRVFPLKDPVNPLDGEEVVKTSQVEWLEAFEADFWAEYPRKVGKFDARKAWLGVKPWTQQTCDEVFAGLGRWVTHWQETETEKRYIPHASTWLNKHRWEDEPDA